MERNLYEKYRKRIVKEGVLKSVLLGVIIGLAAFLITAFFSWFFDYKAGFFIALALFAVIAAACSLLFYFLRYRPTVKQVACRIDDLGLEERMLTMIELEGDDSYIAKAQREDTVRALGTVDHMLLKIAISAAILVPFCVACVLGLGMATVSSLHVAGVIPSGLVTLTPDFTPGVFTATYSVEEGGEGYIIYWTGDWSAPSLVSETGDKVKEGEDAKAVYAVPADDWVFVCWSDGFGDPYRQDTVVDEDIFVQAIFEPMDPDPEDSEAEDSANSEENGDPGQEGQQGEGQDGQDGEPQEGDAQGEGKDDSNGEPSAKPGQSGASGARDLSSQQIVDGQTYYGDQFDDAYQSAKDRLSSDSNIPDDLKGHIEDYYESIETGGETGKDGSGSEGGSEGGN